MAVDASVLAEELAGVDALERAALSRGPRGLRRLWAALWPKLAAIALVLTVWQVVVWSGWRPDYALAGPGPALRTLVDLAGTAVFWEGVGTTLRRAASGYALAVVVGSVVGLAVSRVRLLRVAVGAMITGLQSMPSIAWFPLAILLFQLSETAILFVVVLGAAPSIANGLIAGIDHVPPQLLRAGQVVGARGVALYRHVVLPAALPAVVSGLKQGWAFAWRSLMAGELLVLVAGKPSIGSRLQFARENADIEGLLAWMIVVFVIGVIADGLFSQVDRRVRQRRGLVNQLA